MKFARMLSIFAVLLLMLTAATSLAVIPSTINYQGRLTDENGDPVDTVVAMTFSICLDSAGVACVWGETQDSVVVSDGLFNVKLGVNTPIDAIIFDGSNLWLHVRVNFQPIEPPTEIVSTPYAFRVETVDGADGGRILGDLWITDDVGIGTETPQGALDVNSTTGGLIVPRMTTTERDALTPVDGTIIYNTTDSQFNFYENGAWVTK
jgi:hypothetical protein